MKIKTVLLLLSLAILVKPVFLLAAEEDAILGEWYTEKKKSIVKIYKKGNKYYGKIIWLKAPLDKKGKDKTDLNNPEKKLRKRKLVGLEILKDFEYDGDNEWDDGEIYNPEDGETYSCVMNLEGDKLEVRGYIGISLIGKTTTWKRKR